MEETVNRTLSRQSTDSVSLRELSAKALSVVVIGASGDLAKKKTYPSLFALFRLGFLPPSTVICGYSRSKIPDPDFRDKIRGFLKGDVDKIDAFLAMCYYRNGQYDSIADMAKVAEDLDAWEENSALGAANRMFYFAIPPSVFAAVAEPIKKSAMSTTGWNRMVVEKPFGRDSETSELLGKQLSAFFTEEEIYRIDHYLGKEMTQNLMVLRFGNTFLEPVWNNHHVDNVVITFKEDIGTQGRGGYFDSNGIIRDIIQNHLLQVLTLVAMEPPVCVHGENAGGHVRDEKVKVLQAILPVKMSETVLGQYTADDAGKEEGYLDDPGVPNDSVCPTYATTVLHINSPRWEGVPFVLKAGKALDERKAEIRVQFKTPPGSNFMFGGVTTPRNELVIRLQPDEAVYMKMNVKSPGLATVPLQTEMDLSYKTRFEGVELPDAYTRLLLDVLRGKQSAFVRDDELKAAWKIFTPLLHEIEKGETKPVQYKFGSRGPKESDELLAKMGFKRNEHYTWEQAKM